jgi:hypothetical protein
VTLWQVDYGSMGEPDGPPFAALDLMFGLSEIRWRFDHTAWPEEFMAAVAREHDDPNTEHGFTADDIAGFLNDGGVPCTYDQGLLDEALSFYTRH